jgi:tetratricopeptide (TPR) repeat protein
MPRLLLQATLVAAMAGCQGVSPYSPVRFPQSPQIERASHAEADPIDPPRPSDPLELAADCLERGDEAGAANHLCKYVRANPDQVVFRAQLADLLARLDRLPEAQSHYQAAAALAQDGPARDRLVHYHTRLMEMARLRGDEYAEHLNRGIGLYLVAMRLTDSDEKGDAERLLCKAAKALNEAQAHRPDDARTAWYLYRVWTQLEQPRPAERALRKAMGGAALSELTPTESRELAMAAAPSLLR